jgi:Spy/CpxP family protein refolding chaperone
MNVPVFTRYLKSALIVVLAFATARTVLAFGRHRDACAKVNQRVDKALDAVKASAVQRNQVHAAITEVMHTIEDSFGHGLPDLDEALALFTRDRIDPQALASLHQRRDARHSRIADSLVQAFYDVHDALTHDQRQQLVDYAHERAEGRHMKNFKQSMVNGFVSAQLEDMLDQLDASETERKAVYAARDEILGAWSQLREKKAASVAEVTTLFRSDTIDKEAVARFRAAKEVDVRALTQTIEHAVAEVHAALTPTHRQQLVELIRARRDRMHDHVASDETL